MKNFIRIMIGMIALLSAIVTALAFWEFYMDRITFNQLALIVTSITAAVASTSAVAKMMFR